MKILRTNRCDRVEVPTDDGADHKWTEWTIDVDCWYNPKAMAYSGDFSGVIDRSAANPPVLPADTDGAILEYLMQPRRRLLYQDDLSPSNPVGDSAQGVILMCPEAGRITDVNNGPFVKRCTVNQIHGEKTWHVNIVLTACVRRCATHSNFIKNPLIAHRWTQYEDLDEDYFSTITTEGIATFDGAELLRLGVYPDQYRRDLLFPLAENFKREPLQITAVGDGNTLVYRIVDRQKPLNMNSEIHPMGVTRIEAYQTAGWARRSIFQGVADVGQGVGQGFIEGGPPMAAARAVGGVGRMLPQYTSGVVVNIWGNRNSTRRSMTALAIRIAVARVGDTTLRRGVGFNITHDVMGKFVRVEINYSWGIDQVIQDAAPAVAQFAADLIQPGVFGLVRDLWQFFQAPPGAPAAPANAAAAAADLGPAVAFANAQFPGPWDNTLDILGSGDPNHMIVVAGTDVPSQDSAPNLHTWHPPPPNSNMTRGTSVLNIVSQALTGPCDVPEKPPFLVQYSDKAIYE